MIEYLPALLVLPASPALAHPGVIALEAGNSLPPLAGRGLVAAALPAAHRMRQ